MKEDYTNSDIPLSQYAKDSIEKTLDDEKTRNQIKEDLLTNPRYKEYFSNFSKYSVDNFIDSYSQRKTSWLRYGNMYVEMEEDRLIYYKKQAEKLIWDIQHKKLLNLECLWRAKKIDVPEIRVTSDFYCWHEMIANCHFIEPISEQELEVFVEYLKSDDFDGSSSEDSWTDYSDYKADQDYLPEWFIFYDNRFGTTGLISLPDERGNREEFYMDLARTENYKDSGCSTKEEPKPDIPWGYEGYEDFVKRFEDRKLLQYMRSMETRLDEYDKYEQLDRALDVLKEADEVVPIEANNDWADAIVKAARKYENGKIAQNIVNVYEEYLFRINNRLGFAEEPGKRDTLLKDFSQQRINMILKGMELNGEFPDLNNL